MSDWRERMFNILVDCGVYEDGFDVSEDLADKLLSLIREAQAEAVKRTLEFVVSNERKVINDIVNQLKD